MRRISSDATARPASADAGAGPVSADAGARPAPPAIAMTGPLEPRDGWVADRCPMAAALGVVSTRTAFLVLREAFYGATRFDQFVARTGVSEPVAAARLRELEGFGLLERLPYREPGQRTRHEYALTEKGADLLPVLVALMGWGDRWAVEGGARVELTHAGCGGRIGVALACSEGDEVGGAEEIELRVKRGRRSRAVVAPTSARTPPPHSVSG